MMFRTIVFLIGFGLAVAGGVSTIAYLNLLAAGHSYIDFLLYIARRPECYLLPFGLLVITISLYIPSENGYEE
ncbi:hypothetical protein [Bacillus sp. FJAT-50079]|uniref:hypothetical protein n=1 Tax=Bacillus sp. FJAT-50079 TaxID=2833577 RepID=UPI001BC932C8|nr:hypothetical protein [Bacillus sp. FJAT-50079]MBS4210641.1 hypothetical protein [Bacillus sp. FJAT-50079]